MPKKYLLDACALIAYLGDETGADVVNELLLQARRKKITISMNAANLIEVYYDRIKVGGSDKADTAIEEIYNVYPITIIEKLTPAIVREAAYFKSTGKMSFADTILLATARCTGATVVTCDYNEFKPIEQNGDIPFLWIRQPC